MSTKIYDAYLSLSLRVFQKMHGHGAYDQEASTGCDICAHRRALAAAKQGEKS
jgi:hypothetical protein